MPTMTGGIRTMSFDAVYNDAAVGDIAKKYQIQISTDPAFTTVDFDTGIGGLTMPDVLQGALAEDLMVPGFIPEEGVSYYWRVKFFDEDDNEGVFSTEVAHFSLGITVPTAPTGLLTESTGSGSTFETTFSAVYTDPNTGDKAKKYQIQLSSDPTFTIVDHDTGAGGLPLSLDVIQGDRALDLIVPGFVPEEAVTYYWRVKFYDEDGNEGAYSTEAAFFQKGTTSPVSPVNLTHTVTGAGSTYGVTFSAAYYDADIHDIAKKYQLQISEDAAFSTLNFDSGTGGIALPSDVQQGTRTPELMASGFNPEEGAIYYWRIKFFDEHGNEGDFSVEEASFAKGVTVPSSPVHLFSSGNSLGLFQFSAEYHDSSAADIAQTYQLQISTDPIFTTLDFDSHLTTMPAVAVGERSSALMPAGFTPEEGVTYYWRIKFMDQDGNESPFSTEVATIARSITLPLAPTGLLLGGSTDAPLFSGIYNDAYMGDTADKYQLQISTDPSFVASVYDSLVLIRKRG